MIDADLDIFWENSTDKTATRSYRVKFLPYSRSETGALAFKQIDGEENLFQCLLFWQQGVDAEEKRIRARQWMLDLHSRRTLSLSSIFY